ncbi:MAG: hypothetical protein U0105_09460 [Candidatus Obscuribacterales bacterium]
MSCLRIAICVLCLSTALVACRPANQGQASDINTSPHSAGAVGYVPWGMDEFQFFALTKEELKSRYKDKVEFRDDMRRVLLSPQKGGCAGYDGPTFALTYVKGRVSSVQRIFVGCKETQYGPVLDSKEAALKFSIAGLSRIETLTPADSVQLKTARAELSALQK